LLHEPDADMRRLFAIWLDEPEAALSPQRQLSFLVSLHELVRDGSSAVRHADGLRDAPLPSRSIAQTAHAPNSPRGAAASMASSWAGAWRR
jgi:hypothetical protein